MVILIDFFLCCAPSMILEIGVTWVKMLLNLKRNMMME